MTDLTQFGGVKEIPFVIWCMGIYVLAYTNPSTEEKSVAKKSSIRNIATSIVKHLIKISVMRIIITPMFIYYMTYIMAMASIDFIRAEHLQIATLLPVLFMRLVNMYNDYRVRYNYIYIYIFRSYFLRLYILYTLSTVRYIF